MSAAREQFWKHVLCVQFRGIPLNKWANDLIFIKAHQMRDSKKRRGMVRMPEAEIEIMLETKFESMTYGGMTGTVFKAKIATNKGTTEAEFVIRRTYQEMSPEELIKRCSYGFIIDMQDSSRDEPIQ